MNKIREILLTEYIGAILVAVLVSDAAVALITALVAISYRMFFEGQLERSHDLSIAYLILTALVKIGLYLASAYLLARWLYPPRPTVTRNDAESQQDRREES